MDESKGYIFILSVAKNQQADEEERLSAINVLVELGGEETLDELVDLYQKPVPATLNFKRTLLHAIGKLTQKIEHAKHKKKD